MRSGVFFVGRNNGAELPSVFLMSASPHNQSADRVEQELSKTLRHCPPATIKAARHFRHTRNPVHLPAIILGVLEHYAEPDFRPKLRNAHNGLRLSEDLGLDSLTRIEMALLLEDVLEVPLNDSSLREMQTLGEILKYTECAVSNRAVA